MRSRKAQRQEPPGNPESGDTYEYHSRERRSCAGQKNSIERQNVHRQRSSSSSASIYVRVYTSEADFHKPESYGGRVRVWATEWDVFHCTASRGGRGRRAAVDIFRGVCLVGFRFFFFVFFERTRPTASTGQPCLMYLSTSNEARPMERSDRDRVLPLGKKPLQ